MILAVTGATGFVGSHLLDQALAAGHQVRSLVRRAQPSRPGVTWVAGSLADPADVMAGAEAAIHVAGAVTAPDREAFAAANVDGVRHVLAAARAAGVRRFVHVSSLAAREPALSDYGGSKALGDGLVEGSGLDWTIVRPPTIFGPRDTDVLELFRFAARRIMPLPPAGGRQSVIAVEDLVDLLLVLAEGDGATRQVLEPDDGRSGGWDHRDFARAIGRAVGRRVLPLPLPARVLALGATIDGAARGSAARLTPDRVRYFAHPDWVAHRHPPADLWRAQRDTADALAATARWYRARGLL